MAAHLRTIAPHVNQFLLAGSTGDGWDLDAQQFNDLLAFATHRPYWEGDARFFIGALARSTQDVLRKGEIILRQVGRGQAPGFLGIAVCPPVSPGASQRRILEHYHRVITALDVPLAVYQLPQVTGCTIEPETFAELAAAHPRIILFKDSSGTDAVARADAGRSGVIMVRGAEGAYVESLRVAGGYYDGLLVSTANILAYSLRNVVEMAEAGETEIALRRSRRITRLVSALFEVMNNCSSGNVYSNVNRAVDHLLAHGAFRTHVEAPLLFDGSRLPGDKLTDAAIVYEAEEGLPERGYFLHRYIGIE